MYICVDVRESQRFDNFWTYNKQKNKNLLNWAVFFVYSLFRKHKTPEGVSQNVEI